MDKKIKVALVGAGKIAEVHLEAYKKVSDMEVVAICDINEETLNKTADEFGIKRRYTSLEDMLANEKELDAADVCVWNCSHAQCTIAALNAGLHVLCEKPMAFSAKEAEEMKATAAKNDRLLMVGFVSRFTKGATIVKDFIDNDYLGEVYYAKAQYVRRHGNPGGWFSDKARSGGGPLIDIGVHAIDRARWLMGSHKPVSVYAATFDKLGGRWAELKNAVGWRPDDATDNDICDVEDFATALIRFDNGAVLQIEASYDVNLPETSGIVLCGDKGGMKESDEAPIFYTNVNGHLAEVNVSSNDYKTEKGMFNEEVFVTEMQHFADCILGRCECMTTAEDGVIIMKILDAIYESARTGHEIIIK